MSLPRSVNPTIWQFRARAHVLCAQGKVAAGLAGLNWLHENAISALISVSSKINLAIGQYVLEQHRDQFSAESQCLLAPRYYP
jgi:hypothetical protein